MSIPADRISGIDDITCAQSELLNPSAVAIAASTSAIFRLAVSSAASCFELSSLKITSPLETGAVRPLACTLRPADANRLT